MQEAVFVTGKRKYLFCTDQAGLPALSPIIQQVSQKNISFELFFWGEKQYETEQTITTDLYRWLSQQKMGSYLYVAGKEKKLVQLRKWADEIGYSAEESQFIVLGQQEIRLFCCRCHHINKTINQSVLTCSHCGLRLKVTEHYSPVHDAYLGYVATL